MEDARVGRLYFKKGKQRRSKKKEKAVKRPPLWLYYIFYFIFTFFSNKYQFGLNLNSKNVHFFEAEAIKRTKNYSYYIQLQFTLISCMEVWYFFVCFLIIFLKYTCFEKKLNWYYFYNFNVLIFIKKSEKYTLLHKTEYIINSK